MIQLIKIRIIEFMCKEIDMRLKRIPILFLTLILLIGVVPINAEPGNGAKDLLSDNIAFHPAFNSIRHEKYIEFDGYKGKEISGTLRFLVQPDMPEDPEEEYDVKYYKDENGEKKVRIIPGFFEFPYSVPFSSKDYVDATFNKLLSDYRTKVKLESPTNSLTIEEENENARIKTALLDHALIHEWGRVSTSDHGTYMRVGKLYPEQFNDFGGETEYNKQKEMLKDYYRSGKKISWDEDRDSDIEDIVAWKGSFHQMFVDGKSKEDRRYDFLGSYDEGFQNLLEDPKFWDGTLKVSEKYDIRQNRAVTYILETITRPIALNMGHDKEGNIISITKPLFPPSEMSLFIDKHDPDKLYEYCEDYSEPDPDSWFDATILRYRLTEEGNPDVNLILDFCYDLGYKVFIFRDEKSADRFYKRYMYNEDSTYYGPWSLDERNTDPIQIKNKFEYTEVPVKKVWNDANNKYKKRPDSVKVKLYADGKDTGEILELNKKNKWEGGFYNLPPKESGEEIKYTIEEEKVPGYITEVKGNQKDGYVINNTHEEKVNTGDSLHMGTYIFAALIAIIGIYVALLIKRKNNKD